MPLKAKPYSVFPMDTDHTSKYLLKVHALQHATFLVGMVDDRQHAWRVIASHKEMLTDLGKSTWHMEPEYFPSWLNRFSSCSRRRSATC
jgi:hypothetical protein